jgi:hypothetical protein
MSKSPFTTDIYPATLYVKVLRDKFQDSWVEFEPETLWASIHNEFGIKNISAGAKAAIQAAKTLLGNLPAYTTDIRGFEAVTVGLNNFTPSFEVFEICSPQEINYAYEIANTIIFPIKFDDNVIKYIQACFSQAGVFAYPKKLMFAEPNTSSDVRNQIRARAAEENFDADKIKIDNLVDVQAAKLLAVEDYARQRILMAAESK